MWFEAEQFNALQLDVCAGGGTGRGDEGGEDEREGHCAGAEGAGRLSSQLSHGLLAVHNDVSWWPAAAAAAAAALCVDKQQSPVSRESQHRRANSSGA